MIICTVCYSLINIAFQGLSLFLPIVISNRALFFIRYERHFMPWIHYHNFDNPSPCTVCFAMGPLFILLIVLWLCSFIFLPSGVTLAGISVSDTMRAVTIAMITSTPSSCNFLECLTRSWPARFYHWASCLFLPREINPA
jgi:hypothetical protein